MDTVKESQRKVAFKPNSRQEVSETHTKLLRDPKAFLRVDNLPSHRKASEKTTASEVQMKKRVEMKMPLRKNVSTPSLRAKTYSRPNSRTSNSRSNSRPSSGVYWNPLVPRQHRQLVADANAILRVNNHVKTPFKQTQRPQNDLSVHVSTHCLPSQNLQAKMLIATYKMAVALAQEHPEKSQTRRGTLIRGRLLPMCPVDPHGPSMDHCQGIVTDSRGRRGRGAAGPLVGARRLRLPTSDLLLGEERPHTGESRHCTSVASDTSRDEHSDALSLQTRFSAEYVNEDDPERNPNIVADEASDINVDMSSMSLTTQPRFDIDCSDCDLKHFQLVSDRHEPLSSSGGHGDSCHTVEPTVADVHGDDAITATQQDNNSDRQRSPSEPSHTRPKNNNGRCKESDIKPTYHNSDDDHDENREKDLQIRNTSERYTTERLSPPSNSVENCENQRGNNRNTTDKNGRQNVARKEIVDRWATRRYLDDAPRNFLSEKFETKLRASSARISRQKYERGSKAIVRPKSSSVARREAGAKMTRRPRVKSAELSSRVTSDSDTTVMETQVSSDCVDHREQRSTPHEYKLHDDFLDLEMSLMKIKQKIGRFILNKAVDMDDEDDCEADGEGRHEDSMEERGEDEDEDDASLGYEREVLRYCGHVGVFSNALISRTHARSPIGGELGLCRGPEAGNVRDGMGGGTSAGGGELVLCGGPEAGDVSNGMGGADEERTLKTAAIEDTMTCYEEQLVNGYQNSLHTPERQVFLKMLCEQMIPPKKVKKISTEASLAMTHLAVNAATKPLFFKSRHVGGEERPAASSCLPVCFQLNAQPPQNNFYYFAYGLDMNPDRFSTYIGRRVTIRLWGLLFGFQLVFNRKEKDHQVGMPNIQMNPFSSVEGCLYLLTTAELALVDNCVGYPQNLEHVVLPVWMLNCEQPDSLGVAQYCIAALMYVAKDHCTQHSGNDDVADSFVVDQCLKGADLLTPAYQQHLSQRTNAAN